jgi:hypothetical protein
MDLAWTFGFTDPGGKQSRASRMHATQRAIVAGSRVGVGLDALMHAYREINDDLMARYQLQRDALAPQPADPVDPRQLGDGGCSATTSAVMCCSATPPRASASPAGCARAPPKPLTCRTERAPPPSPSARPRRRRPRRPRPPPPL